MAPLSPQRFVDLAMANPCNREIVRRLPELRLPQCFLTAGCVFQTVWNGRSGQAAQASIRDYDVFYFDDSDLSWEAEDAVIRAAGVLFADLGVPVEIRNQARVHLWYGQRFGGAYPKLRSARDGIDRYLIRCTCIGIDIATGALHAPNGLQEMWDGILRINPRNPRPDLFRCKAEAYRARWPWLTIAG